MADQSTRASMADKLLQEAAENLERPGDQESLSAMEYRNVLSQNLRTIDRALRAFLTWFGESLSEDASLEELTARAVSHFSVFATYRPLVRDLQNLRRAVTDKEHLSLDERESVRRSFYTARNIYAIVLGEIPRELA